MATLVGKADAARTFSSETTSPPVAPDMPKTLSSSASQPHAFSVSASTAAKSNAGKHSVGGAGQSRKALPARDLRDSPGQPAPSIVATTISLIGRGLNKTRKPEVKTTVDGNDISEDVIAAINESIARHRDRGLSARDAFMSVEPEAKKMLASAVAAEKRDDESRVYNALVRKRETAFSITGVCCLVFPILLIFDALTITLPDDFRSVLAMGAQDDSLFGKTALYVRTNARGSRPGDPWIAFTTLLILTPLSSHPFCSTISPITGSRC